MTEVLAELDALLAGIEEEKARLFRDLMVRMGVLDGVVAPRMFGLSSYYGGEDWPVEGFVCRIVLLGTERAVIEAMEALPSECVGVVVSTEVGLRSIGKVERAARRRGMRVIWDDRCRKRLVRDGEVGDV